MLKLRSIGPRDYSVLEGEQRIGRIRYADERQPGVWLWHINVHLTGGLQGDEHPGRRLIRIIFVLGVKSVILP